MLFDRLVKDQSNFTEEVQEPAEPYLSILSFPEEEGDAPSILDYTPTYQGFIRQKETPTVITEKPEQQEEGKVEEVLEDSFGEIPDILLPSLQRPLQGKFRLPREEDTDEEGEEVEEMPPKDIIGELERRKKKKQEEAKAKVVAKSGPSAQGLITKTSQPPGAKVPPPSSPASKRPQSSTTQTKDALAKKDKRRWQLARERAPARRKGQEHFRFSPSLVSTLRHSGKMANNGHGQSRG